VVYPTGRSNLNSTYFFISIGRIEIIKLNGDQKMATLINQNERVGKSLTEMLHYAMA